jgi:hypothetical protein
MLTAFEVLDAEEQERLEHDMIDLIDRYNRRETMMLPSITWGCSEAEQKPLAREVGASKKKPTKSSYITLVVIGDRKGTYGSD